MEKADEVLKKIVANTSTGQSESPSRDSYSHSKGVGDPDCPYCHGIGYLREDAPIGHQNFGKIFVCSCRLSEVENAQKEFIKRIANIGSLSNKTFDNFKIPQDYPSAQKENLKRARLTAIEFAETIPQKWLLLHGDYGCGKTHLAAAIANECIKLGKPVVFVNAPDLLDHLRATFAPNSSISYDELFERIRNTPLLIIDDLGAENPTPWAQEKLYQVFNYRYNLLLPTVITTNVEFGRFDPRIRSRLADKEFVWNIHVDAPDYRRENWDMTDISSLKNHRHQTFASFDLRKSNVDPKHRQNLSVALAAAQDFAKDPKGWLIFVGAPGCGKTHLAAAIANQYSVQGYHAIFVTFIDLLDHLRATFSPNSYVSYDRRFDEIKNIPLLVLDDLAIDSATPWAYEKLKQLIDYRYINELPTIITTYHFKEEIDDWLRSRFLDKRLSTVYAITAPTYDVGREPAAIKKYEEKKLTRQTQHPRTRR